MKHIIIFIATIFLLSCNKQNTEVGVIQSQNSSINNLTLSSYKGEKATIQGSIMGSDVDIMAGRDQWLSQSIIEQFMFTNRNGGEPLSYLIPMTNLNKNIYENNDVNKSVGYQIISIYFEGINYDNQSFELLKKTYSKGQKMVFKTLSPRNKEGLFLAYNYYKNNVMIEGYSGFGDQTGSTWEILDSQEVPLSENAKQAKMTNALQITFLVNCNLYDHDKLLVGEVRNLKLQVILNHRVI